MSRSFFLAGIGFLLGIGLIAGISLTRPYVFRGSEINPAVTAPDFALAQGAGGPYRLSEQKGKIVLIFFGYTTCPDVCPATLGEMRQIHERLGKQAGDVDFVFITVDPERDTPERLAQYVHNFDPNFIGLSGSVSELEPVWSSFGVYRAIVEQNSAVGYLVDHSTRIYLIDPDGNLRATYSFGTPPDDILQDMRHLLR